MRAVPNNSAVPDGRHTQTGQLRWWAASERKELAPRTAARLRARPQTRRRSFRPYLTVPKNCYRGPNTRSHCIRGSDEARPCSADPAARCPCPGAALHQEEKIAVICLLTQRGVGAEARRAPGEQGCPRGGTETGDTTGASSEDTRTPTPPDDRRRCTCETPASNTPGLPTTAHSPARGRSTPCLLSTARPTPHMTRAANRSSPQRGPAEPRRRSAPRRSEVPPARRHPAPARGSGAAGNARSRRAVCLRMTLN